MVNGVYSGVAANEQPEFPPLCKQSFGVFETGCFLTQLLSNKSEGVCVAPTPLRNAIVVARGSV